MYLCVWILLENYVPQCAGWLVHDHINILIHLSEYLAPNFPLEEVDIVLQVVLKMLLKVMNTVSEAAEGICHRLGSSFWKARTNNLHSFSENVSICWSIVFLVREYAQDKRADS